MFQKRLCKRILAASIFACVACGETPLATEVHRERQIAEEIRIRTNPDEVIWLEASGFKFQGLYREAASKDVRGGVILLHGRHSNQDAADLVRPLRQGLPEHGWHSLSLAMPVSEPDDLQGHAVLLSEARARLRSGLAFLKQKNIGNIALLAHDTGAWAALSYFAQPPDQAVTSIVLIDPASTRDLDPPPVSPGSLNTTRLPILEILSNRITARDGEEASRKRAAMKGNSSYRQLVLHGPDQGWQDVGGFLVNHIHGWLTRPPISAGSEAETLLQVEKQGGADQE